MKPHNNGPKGKYRKKTVPVKSFEQNPWGLYQMHGNVWEWCQDRWHKSYNGAPDNGSAWEDGDSEFRVCRGGSWVSIGWILRSAVRSSGHHVIGYDGSGLRLARGPQDRSGYAPAGGRARERGTSERKRKSQVLA